MKKETPKQFIIPKLTKETNRVGSNQHKTIKVKKHFSLSQYFILFNTLLVISISIWAVIATQAYFSIYTWKWQIPVIFQSPLVIHHKPILSPLKSGKLGQIESSLLDVGKIVDNIYTLESSGGKNDGCNSLGKYNGYGFRQNSSEWICYSSHEEVRQLVIKWVETHIKNGDLDSALCLYNKGVSEKGCAYAINYKGL